MKKAPITKYTKGTKLRKDNPRDHFAAKNAKATPLRVHSTHNRRGRTTLRICSWERWHVKKSRGLSGIKTAESFLERLVGLMGRIGWPERHQGLFFTDCRSLHTFFTFLEPDIVFLDKSLKILRIIPSAGSWRFYFGPRDCHHCLELPKGTAKKFGLVVGNFLKW